MIYFKHQYYRELEKATEKRNLSEFIEYAAIGFRDGLIKSLSTLQAMQFTIAWRAFIYDKFSIVKADQRETSFKRRRRLALNFPINIKATLSEIPKLNTEIAFQYGAGTSERMLIRDLEDLIDLKIIQKEDNKYYANIPLLLTASGRLKNKKTSEGEISEALGDLATP